MTPHDPDRTTALPCVARPHTGLVHRDGPCRCFTGGPAPEHDTDLVAHWSRFAGIDALPTGWTAPDRTEQESRPDAGHERTAV